MELMELLSIDIEVATVVDLGDSGTGIRAAPPDVIARIDAGDPVDPSEYYFRTHIRLSTADESLRWMNRLIAVSSGERHQSSVRINVFWLT